jgi:phosphoglycolate phosphatase
MKPILIFDLDGTLIDSKKDLTSSVNYVRQHFSLHPLTEDEIARFIGDGAHMVIRRALLPETSEAAIQAGLTMFLEYYRQHMLDHTDVYPGVRETLDLLGDCTMAVLTNKPVRFSRALLEGLGIFDRFECVYGGNSFDFKKPNPIGIFRILADTKGHREAAWMIGDSAVDVQTGRNAGVRTCGVTYGYAAASFDQAPPDVLIHQFADLDVLINT